MPRNRNRIPTYRLHKPSGQAVVTLGGRDYYLGKHGTPASWDEYHRLVKLYITGGGRLPERQSDTTLAELALAYIDYAQTYYRGPDGRPTSELGLIKAAIRPMRELFGTTVAADFGPQELKVVRERLIAQGWARGTINRAVHRIRRMFRWAASEGLLPITVYQTLCAVPALRRGRSAARESEPVRPVDEETLQKTLQHLGPVVAAMVRLQCLSGARPGEVCALRVGDIRQEGTVWTAELSAHKNAWRGQPRVLYFGPKAQEILRPFLAGKPPEAFVFSPVQAVAEHTLARRNARKTPLWPSHQKAQAKKRKKRPRRLPRDHYDVASYRRAIARACQRAGVPVWGPHRLRHLAATQIVRHFGAEAARVVLGHTTLDTTAIYTDLDRRLAERVMGHLG